MTAFLPRWHGIAHVWHCFIRNVGHYQEGVGATVGEEMEQVNGSISLYGNKTKHMTEKNRNDELTAVMLYLNRERLRRMPTFLAKRMTRARILAEAYGAELRRMLHIYNLEEKDLAAVKAGLIKMAEDSAEKNVNASSIPRTRAVRQRGEILKKASRIISKTNDWHRKEADDMEQSDK
ncbi:uncharacterized protein LOC123470365 isoform X1 [Daphnia magna]|uniref:uncharacterized protein LOC123470365 isoform X1 n=1 Tax=Daphnia magna TaxID=35525 RepID=UPI001E1BBF2A|nr:uncharacterized protein LOC123470365 isoform X1 [Daphnia magna]